MVHWKTKEKTRSIAVKLDEITIEKLDKIADRCHKTRSDFLREVINMEIEKTQKDNPQIFEPFNFKSIHD